MTRNGPDMIESLLKDVLSSSIIAFKLCGTVLPVPTGIGNRRFHFHVSEVPSVLGWYRLQCARYSSREEKAIPHSSHMKLYFEVRYDSPIVT
jgi:hypothetical protein